MRAVDSGSDITERGEAGEMTERLQTDRMGRPMTFLIAGAAGFIGSHLTERLLSRGHTVVGVDSFITGSWRNLTSLLDHPRFILLEHDVVDPLEWDGPLDWILHFASPASPPRYQQNPIQTLRSNAEGTYRLLELARAKRARFLFASTSEVYGDPAQHPQREDYWGNVNPVGARSMYDEAKRYGEAMVVNYHRARGLPVRVIRIFNTYGPRMRQDDGRVIVNFIGQALAGRPLTVYGDGTQTRSFQFIDDLVEGVCRVLRTNYSQPINLGNPEECSMLELAKIVRELTGSDSLITYEPLPKDDPKRRRPDISLASSILDWSPRSSLREGLAATIRYFQALIGLDALRPEPAASPGAGPIAGEELAQGAGGFPAARGHARGRNGSAWPARPRGSQT
ncbi:MAG TPA: UDP-glucuronic acid decarboxylase family protein [Candidatus Eisenbacteria bacterium]|nr:UDP-glucuronic acid decarboxylase family protein [Candidatus Eisenbacteria bacterium]